MIALGPVSDAATFGELYTVTVQTDPAARDPRGDAIRRGMGLLLTRVTGRQQAAAYPEMQQLIDGAARYLAGYDRVSADQVRVGFNEFEINQVLTRLNMPIWGEERPATLLWLAADFGDGQRAELRADDQARQVRAGVVTGIASEPLSEEAAEIFNGVANEILTAADERGLPLVLPALDSEDRRWVRFADVWGGFDRFVARAAERYAVDAILIARIMMTELGPEMQWSVLRGERAETLSTPRARMGIDWLADEFASESATIGGARPTFITIRQTRSWVDFRVLDYLESVSLVESVDIDSMNGNELILRIAARGDEAQFARILALDGVLLPVESETGLVFVPSWRADDEFPEVP